MEKSIYLQLLEKELIPACGCTEPMAFALAAALARKYAPGEIKEIHLKGSGLMVTGVQAVLIPNSHGRHGGFISTAMGVVAGNPDDDMEVLTKITDADLEEAEKLVKRLLGYWHLHTRSGGKRTFHLLVHQYRYRPAQCHCGSAE